MSWEEGVTCPKCRVILTDSNTTIIPKHEVVVMKHYGVCFCNICYLDDYATKSANAIIYVGNNQKKLEQKHSEKIQQLEQKIIQLENKLNELENKKNS